MKVKHVDHMDNCKPQILDIEDFGRFEINCRTQLFKFQLKYVNCEYHVPSCVTNCLRRFTNRWGPSDELLIYDELAKDCNIISTSNYRGIKYLEYSPNHSYIYEYIDPLRFRIMPLEEFFSYDFETYFDEVDENNANIDYLIKYFNIKVGRRDKRSVLKEQLTNNQLELTVNKFKRNILWKHQ